ncbi:hypothetical protein HYT26_01470 [Candidatus Pacearchaeota archaeon]|nr:hypothetical protein [Candidatus Pacearchaeota archaeon]
MKVGVNEIEITKVVKINDGWEVEAFNEESIGKKRSYSIFVDDSREVKSYEKKGLRDSI